MTEIEAYQEYIRCRHNAFCKAVIRYAAIGKIIRLRFGAPPPDFMLLIVFSSTFTSTGFETWAFIPAAREC